VPAAVRSASAVETTAAAGAAKAVESASVKAAVTSDLRSATESLATAKWHAAPESATVCVSTTTVKGWPAPVKSAATIVAMEPRTRADEDAARKVTRTVVSVRSARVRIISVVAVLAYWRWPHVTWPNSDSNPDLCVGCASRNHEKSN